MSDDNLKRAQRALGIDKLAEERAEQKAVDEVARMIAIHRENIEQAERHHQEQMREQRAQFVTSLRTSRRDAVIAGIAALAAIASAWYANVQAKSAAVPVQSTISRNEASASMPLGLDAKVDSPPPLTSVGAPQSPSPSTNGENEPNK